MYNQLHRWGVSIQTSWGSPGHPIVRKYAGPEGEGAYFRREVLGNWQPGELRTLKSMFPFSYGGYAVRLVDISDAEVDIDNDRAWPASFAVVPMDAEEAALEEQIRQYESDRLNAELNEEIWHQIETGNY